MMEEWNKMVEQIVMENIEKSYAASGEFWQEVEDAQHELCVLLASMSLNGHDRTTQAAMLVELRLRDLMSALKELAKSL